MHSGSVSSEGSEEEDESHDNAESMSGVGRKATSWIEVLSLEESTASKVMSSRLESPSKTKASMVSPSI